MAPQLNGKRLELLHEMVPEARRIAVLANPLHPGQLLERADFEAKARQLGIEISFFPIPNRAELDRALAAIGVDPPQAMVLFSDAFVVDNREHIINFAMSRKMPVVSGWSVMAKAGRFVLMGRGLSNLSPCRVFRRSHPKGSQAGRASDRATDCV